MERKLMIIDKGDIRNLTFDEVLQMYKGLIKKKINLWLPKYEYDDLFQVSSVALWKAYKNYDIGKKIGFGLVAKAYIEKELLNHNYLNKPKTENKSAVIKSIASMEDVLFYNSKGNEIKLEDVVGADDYFIEHITEKIILGKVINKLNEREKLHLLLLGQGFGPIEIGRVKNIKESTIKGRHQNLLKKVKSLYAKYSMVV